MATIEEAIGLAKTLGRDEVLLAGERKALPIEGFDLGNSPRRVHRGTVGGKTVVMSTTNGTIAITAAAGGGRVIVGAWTNFQAVVDELVRSEAEPVFLCAGRDRAFGLEDAVCAGQIAAAVMKALPDVEWEMNDGAVAALALAEEFPDPAKLFPHTAAGRAIVEAGLGDDLAYCARVDLRDVLPVLRRPADRAGDGGGGVVGANGSAAWDEDESRADAVAPARPSCVRRVPAEHHGLKPAAGTATSPALGSRRSPERGFNITGAARRRAATCGPRRTRAGEARFCEERAKTWAYRGSSRGLQPAAPSRSAPARHFIGAARATPAAVCRREPARAGKANQKLSKQAP